jgi:hypothetical protein
MARTVCPVYLVCSVSGRSKKSKKCGACSGHTTKLEQSISLDIYDAMPQPLLALASLGSATQIGLVLFCAASPKVAMASKVGVFVARYC